MAASEPNSPTSASPGYANTPEKQDMDLKSLVMMLVQEHMKDILKEIQEKMDLNDFCVSLARASNF